MHKNFDYAFTYANAKCTLGYVEVCAANAVQLKLETNGFRVFNRVLKAVTLAGCILSFDTPRRPVHVNILALGRLAKKADPLDFLLQCTFVYWFLVTQLVQRTTTITLERFSGTTESCFGHA